MRGKLFAIFILFGLFGAAGLLGCGSDPTAEEQGYTVVVRYEANGGMFGSKSFKTYKYRPGTPIIEPGSIQAFASPVHTGYYVDCWRPAETNEDGSPKRDETGQVILSELSWDFESRVVQTDVTLYADWLEIPTLKIDMGLDEEGKPAETLAYSYSLGESVARPTTVPSKRGFTFIDYYADPGYEQPVSWPVRLPDDKHNPYHQIYARFIPGSWIILREPADIVQISRKPGANYWLMKDIDLSENGEPGAWPFVRNFTGTFEGNNHTLSNFLCTAVPGTTDKSFGLFGTLAGGASIRNLGLKNAEFRVELNRNLVTGTGFLVGSMESDSEISGCVFQACRLAVTRRAGSGGEQAVVQYNAGTSAQGVYGNLAAGADPGSIRFEGCTGSVETDIQDAK